MEGPGLVLQEVPTAQQQILLNPIQPLHQHPSILWFVVGQEYHQVDKAGEIKVDLPKGPPHDLQDKQVKVVVVPLELSRHHCGHG